MRAGVLDDVKLRGFHPKSVAWRKSDGSFIAGVTNECLPDDYPYKLVVLPLDRLGVLLYEHIQLLRPIATVEFEHRVMKVGQDEDKAWVEVETPTGRQRREADYAIGCDGASSTVRRQLFGPKYPGETLNAKHCHKCKFLLSDLKVIFYTPETDPQLMFRWNPKPGEYRITNTSPYKLQQRCAPSFRVGRVLPPADAAHLCNPLYALPIQGS